MDSNYIEYDYKVYTICMNCNYNSLTTLKKGVPISKAECENCWCTALRLDTARDIRNGK